MSWGKATAAWWRRRPRNFLEALCHLTAISKSGQLPEPKEIVTLAHADMVRQLIDLESFVTLSYARFDLSRRHLDLVDCGHTGMMVVRARTGACGSCTATISRGIRERSSIRSPSHSSRDLFLFYSDGITEMRNLAESFAARTASRVCSGQPRPR
jgi:sigma-B regulation protein RsbU (phosphoserine phosphatase)